MTDAPKSHIYQRVGTLGVVVWFLSRNWWRLFSRVLFVVFLGWVCFFGGGRLLLGGVMGLFRKSSVANSSAPISSSSDVPGDSAESVKSVSPVYGRDFDPWRVCLLTPDSCCFANGVSLSLGDSYNGKKLVSIDYKMRFVLFGDGRILWMREPDKSVYDDWQRVDGAPKADGAKKTGKKGR